MRKVLALIGVLPGLLLSPAASMGHFHDHCQHTGQCHIHIGEILHEDDGEPVDHHDDTILFEVLDFQTPTTIDFNFDNGLITITVFKSEIPFNRNQNPLWPADPPPGPPDKPIYLKHLALVL